MIAGVIVAGVVVVGISVYASYKKRQRKGKK